MNVDLLKAAIVRRLSQGRRLTVMGNAGDGMLASYDSSTQAQAVVYEFYRDAIVVRAKRVIRIAYTDIVGFDCEEPAMGTTREFDVILRTGHRVRIYVAGEYSARGVDGWAEVYSMHRLLKDVQYLMKS